MLENLIRELKTTEPNKLIKVNYSLPHEITAVYNQIIEAFASYYEKSVFEARESQSVPKSVNVDIFDIESSFSRESFLNEEQIFSLGGKSSLRENLVEITQKNVMLAGGCVSDYVISQYNQTPFKPKDIDVFVNIEFLHSILNESLYKEVYELTISEQEVMRRVLKYSDVIISNDNDVSAESYGADSVISIFEATVNSSKVELVLCQSNKLFQFDINIRNFFANQNSVYTFSSVLEDIKENRIGLMTAHTPYSSIFRLHNIADRLNFDIDSKSLLLLGSVLNNSDYKRFKRYAKKSSHYSYKLERKIISDLGIKVRSRKEKLAQPTENEGDKVDVHINKLIMEVPVNSIPSFNSKLDESVYYSFVNQRFTELSAPFNVPIFNKFLDVFNLDRKFIYKRSDTISVDDLSYMEIYDGPFEDWYKVNHLRSIYGVGGLNAYDNDHFSSPEEYEELKSLLFDSNAAHSIDNDDNFKFRDYIPGTRIPFLPFKLNLHLESLKQGIVIFAAEYLNLTAFINIYVNVEEKTIQPNGMKGGFLGLVSDYYTDFIEQFKVIYGLEGYTFINKKVHITPDYIVASPNISDHISLLESKAAVEFIR